MTERANHKWWTLFAMCFALFMIMLDNTIVNVALPTIQRELDASPANLEWIVNGYVVTFAALILLGGKLGDRFGRKRMFIVGVALFTIFSALCAVADSDTQLIIARCLQGTGAALMNPLSLSILVSAFPRDQIPMAIGVWAGISGLGIAIGPVIGGVLVENFGWASVFWVNVPIGLIAIAVCVWAVVESRDPSATKLDIVGTVLVTTSLLALTFGLIKTNEHSWTSAVHPDAARRRGRAAGDLDLVGDAGVRADGAARVLPDPPVHRGQRRRRAGRRVAVRLAVLRDAVLPEHQGLLRPRGGRAVDADDADHPVRRAARRSPERQGRAAAA